MKINDGFFEDLGRSPGVVALVNQAAERIADIARSTAPVDTGEYRSKIKVRSKYQKRYVALVRAEDPKSMIIEARTGNLVRALQRAKRVSRG